MFCPECGKDVKEGIAFCPSCGSSVDGTRRSIAGSGMDLTVLPNLPVTNAMISHPFRWSFAFVLLIVVIVVVLVAIPLAVIKAKIAAGSTGSDRSGVFLNIYWFLGILLVSFILGLLCKIWSELMIVVIKISEDVRKIVQVKNTKE